MLDFLTGGGWKLYAIGAALLALVAGWGLYERRGAQLEAVQAERLAADVARLSGALKAAEKEAAIQRSIAEAADRAVVEADRSREAVRTRVVTVVREVRLAPDANARRSDAVGTALDRLRGIEAGDRGGDEGGAAGAAPGPAADPRPSRGP